MDADCWSRAPIELRSDTKDMQKNCEYDKLEDLNVEILKKAQKNR